MPCAFTNFERIQSLIGGDDKVGDVFMHCQVTRDCDSQNIETVDSIELQCWRRKADFCSSVANNHLSGLTAVKTQVIDNRSCLNVVKFVWYELTIVRWD